MPDHVRKPIRAAVVTALTVPPLATTGNRAFPGRVYPLEVPELPGLLVYTGDEDVQTGSQGVHGHQERELEIFVEAVFQDLASLDDLGDTILKEVETALLAPGVPLGGLKRLRLKRIEHDRSGEGEKPTERMRMIFSGFYQTARGAPTTAL